MARGAQQDQWGQGISKTAGTGALPPDGGMVPSVTTSPEPTNNPLIPQPITANPPRVQSPIQSRISGGTQSGSSMNPAQNPGMRMRQ